MMTITTRLMLIACLAMPLAACQEDAPAEIAAVETSLTAPTTDDDAAWGNYLTDVVRRNLGNITNTPYLYYLPAETTQGFEYEYERQLEKTRNDVMRGILSGNMLAFGSPTSARMADLIVAAFADVDPGAMEGVRVLFIGDAADNARVQAAVEPSGVAYTFVEVV